MDSNANGVDNFLIHPTPGGTSLLGPREGLRTAIEQGRHPYWVQPERTWVQNCRDVKAIEKVRGIMLRHPAHGTEGE